MAPRDEDSDITDRMSREQEISQDGIAELYAMYAKSLYAFAVNLNGSDNGECRDYVQNLFESVTRNWGTVSALLDEEKRSYLFRGMRNQVISFWRANASARNTVQRLVAETTDTYGYEPAGLLADGDLYKKCMDLIQQLPEQQRKIAFLGFACEWPRVDIAEHLGLSASTVRAALTQVRKKFKALLNGTDHDFDR